MLYSDLHARWIHTKRTNYEIYEKYLSVTLEALECIEMLYEK